MRDPERIPRILGYMETIWERHPDWRFGQLIFNMFDGMWDTREPRLFYFEDDKLECALENLALGIGDEDDG
jgi:hypothetical protein